MHRLSYVTLLLCTLVIGPVMASTTGLNNIPTADVVPRGLLVFQYYGNFGNNNVPDHFVGFKHGPAENVEIGLDSLIFPEKSARESLVGQAKLRFELTKSLAVAGGIANFGGRSRAGPEFLYGALSYDLNLLRLHFGGTLQKDNEGFFGGIDKTFSLFERDLTLRGDIAQVNDGHDSIASAGLMYNLADNLFIEGWVSFPTEPERENFVTLKIGYAF